MKDFRKPLSGGTSLVKPFLRLFDETARYKHRLEVFRDFVTVSAISMHNSVSYSAWLEEEYLRIIRQYKPDDVSRLAQLLSLLIEALDVAPRDVLGRVYMDLELGNTRQGQFFTPDSVSQLMARIQLDQIEAHLALHDHISISEPACGAGGMILSVVDHLLSKRIDPAKRIYVQAIDIDRTAALMCYIQLSLWNVPAEIIVGDCLRLDYRETWMTPAYHLNGWKFRLENRKAPGAGPVMVSTAEKA
ncbi:N-6 DNA methylase [Pseudosulfitobacter pseudonitzschiae]|uniref:N-6 DNA methylase n=1 Tax=Pseudosulfitobacter pseudonitzschiae TaxID=1402135 RepID=UPI003B77773E